MFEQASIDTRGMLRSPWAITASLAGQMAAVSAVIFVFSNPYGFPSAGNFDHQSGRSRQDRRACRSINCRGIGRQAAANISTPCVLIPGGDPETWAADRGYRADAVRGY
jgi:hypothetical protein